MRPGEESIPGVYMKEWPIWENMIENKALWEVMW